MSPCIRVEYYGIFIIDRLPSRLPQRFGYSWIGIRQCAAKHVRFGADDSLCPNSFHVGRMPATAESGQEQTPAVQRARTTMSAPLFGTTVRHLGFDFKCFPYLRPDQRAPQAARPTVRSTAAETR